MMKGVQESLWTEEVYMFLLNDLNTVVDTVARGHTKGASLRDNLLSG